MSPLPPSPDPSAAGPLRPQDQLGKYREMLRGTVEDVAAKYQAKFDASDIVQQTLLDAHRKIDDFRGRLSYKNIPDPLLYERAQFMKYFSNRM